MKILIIYRHFWPDSPPYASMLRTIASHLSSHGHSVTVWAEKPCYKQADLRLASRGFETLDGIDVHRLGRLPGIGKLRLMRYLAVILFPFRVLLRALTCRFRGETYDLVWTATIPPVAQGFAGRLIARIFAAKFLYHCQDIYPEIGTHSGLWKAGGLTERMLMAIERRTRASADALVTLSDDMAAAALLLAEPKGDLVVTNNFMLQSFTPAGGGAQPETRPSADGTVDLIFAGNIGQFQGLNLLVQGVLEASRRAPSLVLTMMGEGKALPELKAMSSESPAVRFSPHRSFEDAKSEIASADVGVVSLERGIYRYAFPSKTMTYLGLGVPILCIVEKDSELSRMIIENRLGWVSGRDPQEIADTLAAIAGARSEMPEMRSNCRTWYERELAAPAALGKWSATIDALEGQGSATELKERDQ